MGIFTLILPLVFLGCSGDDGSQGAQGIQGPPGPPGAGAAVVPESCSICHNGNIARDGFTHQESYNELYQDGVIVVTNLAYANDNVSDIVTFNMTKAGQPFDCTELNSYQEPPNGTGSSIGIYFVEYDDPTRSFNPPAPLTSDLRIGQSFSVSGSGTVTPSTLSYNPATNLCTSTKAQSTAGDLSGLNGLVIVYGRNEARSSAEESPELRFTRVVQPKYPFAAVLKIGTVAYASAANVTGCERCHTVPFLKHGYIYGLPGGVAGTDFYTCKACHNDDGAGGHFEWQLIVEDPPRAASFLGFPPDPVPLTDAEKAQYAYRTRLMNDVHMSHGMEFPYPMSMSNCVACHEGKLTTAVLTDANFTPETCFSCHPENGPAGGTDEKRAPALRAVAPAAIHGTMNLKTAQCNLCHSVTGGFSLFSDIHTGYDKQIYADAVGTKYSAAITASIDNASFAGNVLTITFSATGSAGGVSAADIAPTVLVGLYGYDTKDWYVGPHERDFDDNGDGSISSADQRNLEYVVGRTNHPRFTTVSATSPWVVTADLSAWDNLITSGKVKRVEIAFLPTLVNPALPAGDNVVALNAPSRTFDLGANAFVANYFSGTNAIVRVDTGCNNCHDALADTFHSPDRGGNIVVCRLCHITKDGGSHLEMQSRSIDSYAHGIHSFQPFDIGEVNFNDPVEAMHYQHHIEFAFPTLGRTNCEACHNPGKFNVPDQSKSLSGILSESDARNQDGSFRQIIFNNLNEFPNGPRNIGDVPSYVAGPAARACGGCHRVNWINEDAAGELASFYSHTRTFGYLVETTSETHNVDVLDAIDAIFSAL